MFTSTYIPRVAVMSVGLIIFSISSPFNAFAASEDVNLEWSPNSEPDLAGYNVYHGTKSGVYGFPDNVQNKTSHEKKNLDPTKRHYFAVTAYDNAGNESTPSDEVKTPAPSVSPSPAPPSPPPAPPSPPPASGLISFTAAHSKKCLEIPGSSQNNSVDAIQSNCDGGENQQFELKSAGADTFQIIAKHSGKCLDIHGASTANRARVIQYTCHTGDNQRFRLTSSPATLVAVHSGKCIDVAEASTSNGATVFQYACHGNPNQQWAMTAGGTTSGPTSPAPPPSPPSPPPAPLPPVSGFTTFKAGHSNKCLEIPGNSLGNVVGAVQSSCDGGDNQQFQLKPVGTDTFQVIAKHSGKCLDINRASTGNRARLIQYTCHNEDNQRFRLTGSPSRLVAVHSGKCVDVAEESTSNGATVFQYACHGNPNQQWTWGDAGITTSGATPSLTNPAPTSDIMINFQPAGATLPSGYKKDDGSTYNSGRGYGWNRSVDSRDRNSNNDQRLDTFIFTHKGPPATWTYDLPNGDYLVSLASGDPVYSQGAHHVSVEGQSVIQQVSTKRNEFLTITDFPVTVTDGNLTINVHTNGQSVLLNYVNIKLMP